VSVTATQEAVPSARRDMQAQGSATRHIFCLLTPHRLRQTCQPADLQCPP
jgi:hypothetical protein